MFQVDWKPLVGKMAKFERKPPNSSSSRLNHSVVQIILSGGYLNLLHTYRHNHQNCDFKQMLFWEYFLSDPLHTHTHLFEIVPLLHIIFKYLFAAVWNTTCICNCRMQEQFLCQINVPILKVNPRMVQVSVLVTDHIWLKIFWSQIY